MFLPVLKAGMQVPSGPTMVHTQLCFLLEIFRLLKQRYQLLLRSGICCLDSGKKFSGLVSDTMRCSIWAEADVGGPVSFLISAMRANINIRRYPSAAEVTSVHGASILPCQFMSGVEIMLTTIVSRNKACFHPKRRQS